MNIKAKSTKLLAYFDGPVSFLCEDSVGTKYVCVLINRGDDEDQYLAVSISSSKAHSILTSDLDLRSVFEKPEIQQYFIVTSEMRDASSVSLALKDPTEINTDWYPLAGTFINIREIDAPSSDLIKMADSENSAIFEYSLNPPESSGETRVSTPTLIGGLQILQSLFKYSFKNSIKMLDKKTRKLLDVADNYQTDVIGFAPGSFKIMLKSKNIADFTGYVSIEKAFERLHDIIKNDENPEKTIDLLRDNQGHLVTTYIRLLEFVIKNNCPITYRWSVPNGEKAKSGRIGKKVAEVLYEKLSTRSELKVEKINCIGEFEKVDVISGAWSIRPSEGKKISGGISEKSKKNLYAIQVGGKKYRLDIEETLEESEVTGKEYLTYTLIDYSSTDEEASED